MTLLPPSDGIEELLVLGAHWLVVVVVVGMIIVNVPVGVAAVALTAGRRGLRDKTRRWRARRLGARRCHEVRTGVWPQVLVVVSVVVNVTLAMVKVAAAGARRS